MLLSEAKNPDNILDATEILRYALDDISLELLFHQHLQGKAATLSIFAGGLYATSVQAHDLLTQAQANARSGRLGREERNEDSVQHLRQDATTVIGNRQHEQMPVGMVEGFYNHLGILPFLASFAGILYQVYQYLLLF